MVKRGYAFLLSGFLMLLLLSACGEAVKDVGSNDPGGEKGKTDIIQVKTDPAEFVVYFPFGADWNEEQFMEAFGTPIKQKFPHVSLQYIAGGTAGNSVKELLAAGQRIDILFASIGATPTHLLDSNLQYDISPQIKKYNYDLNQLEPSMVDMAYKLGNGEIYGLPVYVPPSAIYYNRDIFDKFGVDYPGQGLTWDGLYEIHNKISRKEDDVQYLGLGSSYGHLVIMNQLSLPLVVTETKKATFDTLPQWKGFLENFVRFYKIPGYDLQQNQTSEPNERNRFFRDRIIAMFISLTALHQPTEINEMNWDLAPYPVFKDNPGVGSQAYPTYFYITTMAEQKDQAFEVIAYLTSKEYQIKRAEEGRFLTTLTDSEIRGSFGKNNPMYQGRNVQHFWPVKYAPAGSVNKYNSMASGELQTAIRQVILENKDINTALREAAERTNKRIEEMEAASK